MLLGSLWCKSYNQMIIKMIRLQNKIHYKTKYIEFQIQYS